MPFIIAKRKGTRFKIFVDGYALASRVSQKIQTLQIFCKDINAVKEKKFDDWWIAKGATHYKSNKMKMFKTFEKYARVCHIRAAGKEILQVQLQLLIPEVNRNLFSVPLVHNRRRNSCFTSTPTHGSFKVNAKTLLIYSPCWYIKVTIPGRKLTS